VTTKIDPAAAAALHPPDLEHRRVWTPFSTKLMCGRRRGSLGRASWPPQPRLLEAAAAPPPAVSYPALEHPVAASKHAREQRGEEAAQPH
jgi:hypothetical protein